MKQRQARFLRKGRQLMLESPDVLNHALECADCGLRPQALLVLALVEWDEVDWYTRAGSPWWHHSE